MGNVKTMIKALRALSSDMQSGDGAANACISDAADMIVELSAQLAKSKEIMALFAHMEDGFVSAKDLINQAKIEAHENCIKDNEMDSEQLDALIIYVDDVMADIEQLRKEQQND